jgi:hypothetical protein
MVTFRICPSDRGNVWPSALRWNDLRFDVTAGPEENGADENDPARGVQ